MYNYNPLWRTMQEKNITTYKLIKCGIEKKTIYNLHHGKNVTVLTLEKLCTILECPIEGVVEIIPAPKEAIASEPVEGTDTKSDVGSL